MTNLDQFRQDTRIWLEDNCPEAMRSPESSDKDVCWGGRKFVFQSEGQRLWLERMAQKGWTVPTWPTEYGGGGLSKEEAKILLQEMARIKARSPLQSFGIWMLGPALLKYGSDAQKRAYLPQIARGEIRWCQGYSEPGAGSDLASLQTKAEDNGDHWLVNGSKIWTSYADEADWIFCLVRTEPDASKHKGISFLLFDMASEGVSTSPIQLISGVSPFCQTFFDDVVVPKDNLVGERGNGWTIAKYLLTHEREMIGAMGFGGGTRKRVSEIALAALGEADGLAQEASLRTDIARHEIDSWAFALTMERMKDEAKAGQGIGAASSMLKYYGTELNKERHQLIMAVNGSDAFEWESERSNGGSKARSWLRTRANSIEGGTSEVQLNIISKHILQLPDA